MDIIAYIADKTANHQDASLDDTKVKEILSDNKSYVKTAGDTSFITIKGEYEIPYSELYNAPITPTKLSDNELKSLLEANTSNIGQIDEEGNITTKLLWNINPLNETECELLGEVDYDYGPTSAYLGDSTSKNLEGGFPKFIKKDNKVYKVTIIGEGALSNLKIENLNIPEGITELGESAFELCFDLKTIFLPQTLTKIGKNTFGSCTSLETIVIPDSVESIGQSAFDCCTGLTSVTIGENVTDIGTQAFNTGGSVVDEITIKSANIANGLSSKWSQGYLIKNATIIYIKDNITTIGSYVTSNYTQTTSDKFGYIKYVKN